MPRTRGIRGPDLLIGTAGSDSTLAKLVSDADTNGDIYVGVLDSGPGAADTLHVWRSTDAGYNWVPFYNVAAAPSSGGILDCEMRVGHDADGTWLYDFLVIGGGDSTAGLWCLRHRPPLQDSLWTRIADGDSILRVAADRNVEWPEGLFVAYETQNGLIRAAVSSDCGQTWGDSRTAFTQSENPAICAGGFGAVYVVANRRDSTWLWAARYGDNLGDTNPTVRKVDSSSAPHAWNPSVAADRDGPDTLQTALTMYTRRAQNGQLEPYFALSQNSGRYWSPALWPPGGGTRQVWDARFPCVRRSYADDLFRAVVTMYNPTGFDTIIYAFCRPTSPGTWEARSVRNDITAAGGLEPVSTTLVQVWVDMSPLPVTPAMRSTTTASASSARKNRQYQRGIVKSSPLRSREAR